MKCAKCKGQGPLFRDRPKGQTAKFVCLWCMPDGAQQPDPEVMRIVDMMGKEPQ